MFDGQDDFTGFQVIQTIAPEVDLLKVSIRTLPMKNLSMWNRANVPGKPHGQILSYLGVGDFRERADALAASGYKGFEFS
ncbi:hypothetical protein HH308_18445 [Gordonia sp. TBRC 11910]|uniref:Uncharacterized protein n=1 Tax=Gordonia asplenii TaxID=2725283 RepID=A0A848KYI5_9ACTN|nr:hypothetical protein [Gordonia asplenii]NMO03197.1 hypothetical protein [Gordonia asplenii]